MNRKKLDKVILDHLEADATAWEEVLDAQEKDDGNENDDTSSG